MKIRLLLRYDIKYKDGAKQFAEYFGTKLSGTVELWHYAKDGKPDHAKSGVVEDVSYMQFIADMKAYIAKLFQKKVLKYV